VSSGHLAPGLVGSCDKKSEAGSGLSHQHLARDRVVWFRDAGGPTCFRGQAPNSLHSPLPQHRGGRWRAAQNEGRWTQSAWLLAQGMLGFQWLKARVQSAEAQQVAGAVDFCDGRIWRIGSVKSWALPIPGSKPSCSWPGDDTSGCTGLGSLLLPA